ncbi:outer membrane protein transport protein [bacterium]|nr:outer membrane protein transport protein [bacterium]
MKKLALVFLLLFAVQQVFAGGLLTNTNQSSQFIRMFARNASTDIDAVYFNPAGLTQLPEGWSVALHNQYVQQVRTIETTFPTLNNGSYEGTLDVPFFPTFFLAYNTGKWAVSAGFGVNAGGGSAEFAGGLPSFEMGASMLPGLISGLGVPTTQYSMDMSFQGQSMFYGFQGAASFQATEKLAVAAGVRYLIANNAYEGYIKDIKINPTHPLINPTGAMMSAAQFFTLAGLPQYAAMVQNIEVDAEQTGTAITPFVSVNYKANENWNFALKYELKTALELEMATKVDGSGQFPDGAKINQDIPAILAAGVTFMPTSELTLALSGNYYFDKDVDWDGREEFIDTNSWEVAVGAEYDVTEKLALSAGFLYTDSGVDEEYQNDLSHSLDSKSVGVGGNYQLTDALDVDFGYLQTLYDDYEKPLTHPVAGPYVESYKRTNYVISVGLGLHF